MTGCLLAATTKELVQRYPNSARTLTHQGRDYAVAAPVQDTATAKLAIVGRIAILKDHVRKAPRIHA